MRVWPLFILSLVIYFHAFSQYSVWQTTLLQESFENHMPSASGPGSVEAAGAGGPALSSNAGARQAVLVVL